MNQKIFENLIDEWQKLHYACRRFARKFENLTEKFNEEQRIKVMGMLDQHEGWYEKIGLYEEDEVN